MHSVLDNQELMYVGAAVANGSSTDSNSTRIDMAGYESVTFVCAITDCADTGVAAMTIESNSADSDTGMTAVSGAVSTVTSAANDDLNGTLLAVEIRKPSNRYVQCVRTSATANIAFGTVTAILKPYRVPATQGATVSAAVTVSD